MIFYLYIMIFYLYVTVLLSDNCNSAKMLSALRVPSSNIKVCNIIEKMSGYFYIKLLF